MNYDDLFNLLAADASRNFKIATLQKHQNDETLKEIIRLALDPFTQFYQRKIPKYSQTYKITFGIEWAIKELDKLSSRQVTGHAAIDHLTYILSSLTPEKANVIERIIAKDLKCGVSIATVNAVWPNLIAEYPCMLCSQYEEKLVSKIKFPAYVQMKMDGMRFNAIVHNGAVQFRSRNGKELHLLGNLEKEFLSLANGKDCVFDGELMVMDTDGHQFVDRQTGNGTLNKANKGTISEKEAAMVHAALWDVIPYDDFVKGVSNVPYRERWEKIERLVNAQPTKNKRIWSVYTKEVANNKSANEEFEQLLADGYEGIILKDFLSKWENKRSKTQIKFKGELEGDLKIVGIQAGTGKYQGMLGAILCESADGIVKVSVGSGFNDVQRLTYGYELIGKIVAVKYNARIKNKEGQDSLFLPVFICIRFDKDEADSSKDIK
jgi:hypothetical protein